MSEISQLQKYLKSYRYNNNSFSIIQDNFKYILVLDQKIYKNKSETVSFCLEHFGHQALSWPYVNSELNWLTFQSFEEDSKSYYYFKYQNDLILFKLKFS